MECGGSVGRCGHGRERWRSREGQGHLEWPGGGWDWEAGDNGSAKGHRRGREAKRN